MSAEIHFPAERLAELAGLGAQFHAEASCLALRARGV